MPMLQKIWEKFLESAEFKGKEGRKRDLTWWDIGFVAAILFLIGVLIFILVILGVVKP